MKICVLGAGALGSSIGGLLTEAGLDVYLVDTWKEHVDAMIHKGLRLTEQDNERVIAVRATDNLHTLGVIDLLIVLVKSYFTEEAVFSAKSMVGTDTMVLSLQNGLGNEEIIAKVIGEDHVLGGVTHAGAVLLAPAQVLAGWKGKRTYIGALDRKKTARANEISQMFNAAGIETVVAGNIYEKIWNKLLVNVAVSPLSAITGLPHAGMAGVREVVCCAEAAVAEAIAVAKAGGVVMATEDPSQIWKMATEGLPKDHKSSMLQDIEKGARTEIDFINGAVVKRGEQHGVPTPVNRTLVAGVKGIEYCRQKYE